MPRGISGRPQDEPKKALAKRSRKWMQVENLGLQNLRLGKSENCFEPPKNGDLVEYSSESFPCRELG